VPGVALSDPAPAIEGYYGAAVAISGNQAVVGAYNNANGRVIVYDLTSATPEVPTMTLLNPSVTVGVWFGLALDISCLGIRWSSKARPSWRERRLMI
jgi:hypothetical protein